MVDPLTTMGLAKQRYLARNSLTVPTLTSYEKVEILLNIKGEIFLSRSPRRATLKISHQCHSAADNYDILATKTNKIRVLIYTRAPILILCKCCDTDQERSPNGR